MDAVSNNKYCKNLGEQRTHTENLNSVAKSSKSPAYQSQKIIEREYQKNKLASDKIVQFHMDKRKQQPVISTLDKNRLVKLDQVAEELDPNDEELMNQRVQLYISFTLIDFVNFIPRNAQNEKYFMEIKASSKDARFTTPEIFDDFAKSVINEFFYIRELRESKLLYIGIFQLKEKKQIFLGDFEIDLTPYYQEGTSQEVSMDLRNYKELAIRPKYIPTDMRRRGSIKFDLKITSNVKRYLLDQKEVQSQASGRQQQQQSQQQQQQSR